jgi:hypothetical protein
MSGIERAIATISAWVHCMVSQDDLPGLAHTTQLLQNKVSSLLLHTAQLLASTEVPATLMACLPRILAKGQCGLVADAGSEARTMTCFAVEGCVTRLSQMCDSP